MRRLKLSHDVTAQLVERRALHALALQLQVVVLNALLTEVPVLASHPLVHSFAEWIRVAEQAAANHGLRDDEVVRERCRPTLAVGVVTSSA